MLVICLHGLGASSASFVPLKDRMKLREGDFLAPDCPGHGPALDISWSGDPFESMAQQVVSTIEATQRDVILVGHSMGGALAMLIARIVPDRISALVSIEGNLIGEDCGILSRKLAKASLGDIGKMKGALVSEFSASNSCGWRQWARDIAPVTARTLKAYAGSLVSLSDSRMLLDTFTRFKGAKAYIHGDAYIGHPVLAQLGAVPIFHAKGAEHFVMQDDPAFCANVIARLAGIPR